ncbi:hypothetical protein Tco_1046511 [Tanacetum coccineum]
MPRDPLFRCDPFWGCYRLVSRAKDIENQILSCQFEHSYTVTYTSVSEDDFRHRFHQSDRNHPSMAPEGVPPSPTTYLAQRTSITNYVPGPREARAAPPSPIYKPFCSEPVLPVRVLTSRTMRVLTLRGKETIEEDDEDDPEEDPDSPNHNRRQPHRSLRGVAERLLALPTSTTHQPLSPYQPKNPTSSDTLSRHLPISSPPPNGPTYVEGSLGARAAGIRQRDALPSPVHETEMLEIYLPLRKRPRRTTPGPGYEVGESSTAGARQFGPTTAEADLYGFTDMLDTAPGCQTSKELGYGITDTWDDLVGAIQEIAPTTPRRGVTREFTEFGYYLLNQEMRSYIHTG